MSCIRNDIEEDVDNITVRQKSIPTDILFVHRIQLDLERGAVIETPHDIHQDLNRILTKYQMTFWVTQPLDIAPEDAMRTGKG